MAWTTGSVATTRQELRSKRMTAGAGAVVFGLAVALVGVATLAQAGQGPKVVVVPTTALPAAAPASPGDGALAQGDYLPFCSFMAGVVGRLVVVVPSGGKVTAGEMATALGSIDMEGAADVQVPGGLKGDVATIVGQLPTVAEQLRSMDPAAPPQVAQLSPPFLGSLAKVLAAYQVECR